MATALEDEIRRRRIEDALLLDTPNLQDSDKPDTADKDVYGDWRKWPALSPEEAADIPTIDQESVPAGHIDLAPPGHIDLTPPAPRPPEGLQTDPESGQRYVVDPSVVSGIVPYAELATSADKEAFKPSDVTLSERTVEATDQVKRAQLVSFPGGQPATMPWHPAGQKPVPGFVEGSQNAILNPAAAITPVRRAELVDPDPDLQYLDPEVRRAAQVGTTPRAYPAAPPTGPKAPGTHTELAPPGQMDLRPDEPQAVKPVVQPTPSQPAVKPVANDWTTWTTVDGTRAEPPVVQPKAGVQADTSGADNTGTADYFRKRGEAPITDENDPRLTVVSVGNQKWNVHKEAAPYFQGFLQELADQGAPLRSDGGWNYRQKVGAKGLSEHAWAGAIDVNQEGRDEVTPEFRKWILDHPEALQAAEQRWHIYGGERFGDLGHFEWGGVGGETGTDSTQVIQQLKDSGLNATHYGYDGDPYLDAESAAGHGKYVSQMVSGYDVALNAAAARLVGNPQPGQEFQYAGRTWRYGDKVPEKYADARFDIFDPTNTALSGGRLGGTSQQVAQPKKQDWESWATLSPAEEQQANQEGTRKQQDILTTLQKQTSNMPAFMHALEKPIPGVNDEVRNSVMEEYKKQITAYAQDYYKESDPDKAYARIMSNADPGTFFGEIGSKILPNLSHAGLSFAKQATSESPLMQFINIAQPNASPEARVALFKEVMAQPDEDRTNFVKALYSHLSPDVAQNVDLNALLNWSDTFSQPGVREEQARRQVSISAAVAQNRKDLREDPTLQDTLGGTVANALAAFPKNAMEVIVPVIGQSVMASEIYDDTLDGLRKDHPDWTEDQLKAKAAAVSIPQDVLQELINLGTLGLGGSALKGITNPLARMAASAILHGTATGTIGVGQQALTNVITGKAPDEGLFQAGVGGFTQGFIGGAWGGRHGVEAIPEHVAPTEPVRSPEAPAGPLPPQPVTREGVLGPNVPDTSVPWYKPGPVVTRGVERTTFTPSELAEQAGTLTGRTPEELQAAAEKLRPPTDFTQRQVFLDSAQAQQSEIDRAQAAQAPQPTPEQQAAVDRTNVVRGATGGSQVGAENPFLSRVASRFTAERMASGELGPVEPGTGVTKEEMLARGLKMGSEEINQHVSDVMNNRRGDPKAQASALRAEEARLSQRSHDLSLIAESDRTNKQAQLDADNALKDLTDFHNGPIAKLKNDWHAQGMSLQGEIPVDLSTFNGLRKAYLDNLGKEPPASAEPEMRKAAKKMREADAAHQAAMGKLGAEIERQTAKRNLPHHDMVRENIAKRMRGEFPCAT